MASDDGLINNNNNLVARTTTGSAASSIVGGDHQAMPQVPAPQSGNEVHASAESSRSDEDIDQTTLLHQQGPLSQGYRTEALPMLLSPFVHVRKDAAERIGVYASVNIARGQRLWIEQKQTQHANDDLEAAIHDDDDGGGTSGSTTPAKTIPSRHFFEYSRYVQHACVPNAEMIWHWTFHAVMSVATHNINAGDEIYLSFLTEREQILPASARRQALLARDGVYCNCAACRLETEQTRIQRQLFAWLLANPRMPVRTEGFAERLRSMDFDALQKLFHFIILQGLIGSHCYLLYLCHPLSECQSFSAATDWTLYRYGAMIKGALQGSNLSLALQYFAQLREVQADLHGVDDPLHSFTESSVDAYRTLIERYISALEPASDTSSNEVDATRDFWGSRANIDVQPLSVTEKMMRRSLAIVGAHM